MKETLVEILNDISEFPEESLLEKMLSYCEMNDLDPQELGDMFAENDQFKRKLWINCVENYQIKDTLLQDKIASVEDLDEW